MTFDYDRDVIFMLKIERRNSWNRYFMIVERKQQEIMQPVEHERLRCGSKFH